VEISKKICITQILREIKFGSYRSSKMPFLAILMAQNFAILGNFSFQEVQKYHKNQNSEPLKVSKMSDFALLEPPKLISRKI